MSEFFNNLYEIENFTTYLLIAIGVLVVLFFLVLFLGKRDQKIEETKRLKKLEMKDGSIDTFKETTKEEKVEIKKENVDILIPPVVKEEEIKVFDPVAETKKEEVTEEKNEVIEPAVMKMEEEVTEVKEEVVPTPVIEDTKPILEDVVSDEIKLPDLNFDDVKLDVAKEEEPKKEEVSFIDLTNLGNEPASDDLPKLKDEVEPASFTFDTISGETYNLDDK